MPAAKRTSDSNLAARELGFLVRLAQAAASTQKPDELLALIIRETTTAMGTDVCSRYLLMPSGRELLLTATNGLNETAVGALAGGPAALYSPDGHRVRGVGVPSDGMPPRLHVPGAVSQAGAREVRISAGRPARPIDLVPVRAGADVLGLLAVGLDARAADSQGRVRALEHGSTVLALEMSKERAAAEVERRLRGDLGGEMLGGGLGGDGAGR